MHNALGLLVYFRLFSPFYFLPSPDALVIIIIIIWQGGVLVAY